VQRPGTPVAYHVTAPGYIATNIEVTVRNHEFAKSIPVRLSPEPVKITLLSDPPNARFFAVGEDLRGANGEYFSRLGPRNARRGVSQARFHHQSVHFVFR